MTDLQTKLHAARKAFGDADASREIHSQNTELFNVQIRQHKTIAKQSVVFGGLLGWMMASSAVGVYRAVVGAVGSFSRSGAASLFRKSNVESASGSHKSGHAGQVLASFLPKSNNETPRNPANLPISILVFPIACSLSVGFLLYKFQQCNRWFYDQELEREKWEMENYMQGEIDEIVAIYQERGLSHSDAETVALIFAKNRQTFLELMMVEELGYSRSGPLTAKETAAHGVFPITLSHALFTVLPVAPFVLPAFFSAVDSMPDGDNYKTALEYLPEIILAVEGVFLAIGHSFIMHGEYTSILGTIPVIIKDATWGASMYLIAMFAGKALKAE